MRATTQQYEPGRCDSSGALQPPVRVFMMDLLSIVPYYDGHLCAALAAGDGLAITLGAITYQHDRGYFRRQGVQNRPGLDIAARLPLPAALLRPLKALEASINLAALALRLAVWPPDVLHVQFLPLMERGIPFERWVLRAARGLGIKVVHTVHNVLPPATERRTTGRRLEGPYREIYGSADALICHDDGAKARLVRQFGVAAERVRVIPHGPLFEDACSATREEARGVLGLQADECLVLWQGILEPYKGVSFLLNAWREVAAREGKVRLAIVGPGKLERIDALRREVAALDIGSSVRLELRFVPVEELGYWYRASDVLVYPYREATTSGALMTGINYAKPIVATTVPAFCQVLRHGENALLVDYGDVEGLALELGRLISDERLRRLLAERTEQLRMTVPRWPAIARETREYYEAVVNGTRSRSNPADGSRDTNGAENGRNSEGSALRGFIRTGTASMLHWTRTDRVMGALAGARKIPVVLGYHRVVEDFPSASKSSIAAMLISRPMLERHLQAVARRFRFVSLDELSARLEGGEQFHEPVAALTFDDGYSDFYHHAFPLLQKMGIPSTVFVVTGLIGTPHVLTHDRLYGLVVRAFSKWRQPSRELARLLRELDIEPTHVEHISSLATSPYPAMRALFLTLPQAETHRVLQALDGEVGTTDTEPGDLRLLNFEMLLEMHRAGISIGSHTRTHPLLTNEKPQRVGDEVAGSKEDLERRLGVTIRHFAYPGGYFDTDTVQSVADAGYRFAYTTCLHRDPGHPSLTIPRKILWENSCLDAHGHFSPAMMSCQVRRSFDLFRRCDQDHQRAFAGVAGSKAGALLGH